MRLERLIELLRQVVDVLDVIARRLWLKDLVDADAIMAIRQPRAPAEDDRGAVTQRNPTVQSLSLGSSPRLDDASSHRAGATSIDPAE